MNNPLDKLLLQQATDITAELEYNKATGQCAGTSIDIGYRNTCGFYSYRDVCTHV